MIVIFAQSAESDLDAIFDSLVERASERTAFRMIQKIESRCMSLDLFPERGTRLVLAEHSDLRFLIEKPYLIAYRVRADVAEIVAVLHGARDIGTLLRRFEGP